MGNYQGYKLDAVFELLGSENGEEVSKGQFLSSFKAHSNEYVFWVQFASAHNQAEKFWRAFSRELRKWDKMLGGQMSKQKFPSSIPEITRFLQLIAQASHRSGKAIFVFDGVHYLDNNSPIKNLVLNMIHVKTDSYNTLVIKDNRVDIGGDSNVRASRLADESLQFTREEVRVYYTALGIVLDEQSLDGVYELTEGWTTAVHMLSRHLFRRELITPAALNNALTYMDGVFYKQYYAAYGKNVQRSLVLLSLLEDFTMELAVDLTFMNVKDLGDLVDHNGFILGAPDVGSYRFHKLYHNFLRVNQIELSPKSQTSFLRSAADWYKKKGNIRRALSYYHSGEAYGEILATLDGMSIFYTDYGLALLIEEILSELPPDAFREDCRYHFYFFLAQLRIGKFEEAFEKSELLKRRLEDKERDSFEDCVLGELYIIMAFYSWMKGTGDYLPLMEKANELLTDGAVHLDIKGTYLLGESELCIADVAPGGLLEIKDAVLKALPYIKNIYPKTGASRNYLSIAQIHMYRMEMEEAREYTYRAIAEASSLQDWGAIAKANFLLLHMCIFDEELDDFLYYADQVELFLSKQRHPANGTKQTHLSKESILCAFLGVSFELLTGAKDNPLEKDEYAFGMNGGRELYMHGWYLVHVTKQYYAAISYLDLAIPLCHRKGMLFYKIYLVLLKAVAYNFLAKEDMAVQYFCQAYLLSEENGILLPFAEYGENTVQLIRLVQRRRPGDLPPDEWCEEVKSRAESFEKNKQRMVAEYRGENYAQFKGRLNKLTTREYEVLQDICLGNEVSEISRKFGVLPATIYTYLHRIYTKLNVTEKEEAVKVAMAEGILEELVL